MSATPTSTAPLLEVRNLEKSFPGVRALSGVSFDVSAGEVHALLGENGAGKSTLIKIVSGVYQPDAGEILIDGRATRFATPEEAKRAGVATIYQELLLFPELTVAENIFLGHAPRARGGRIDWRAMRAEAEALLASLEIDDLAADQIVGALSVGHRQRVEILRALSHDARILIMDEPTAALTESDVTRLFDIVRKLKSRGVGIVYISHRLDELFEIADRVTVLRDGAYVGSRAMAETNAAELVQMMVGRRIENLFPKTAVPIGAPVLEARDLVRRPMTRNVSLTVRAGEIVGLAGLVGSGRSELAQVLFGITPAEHGDIRLMGEAVDDRLARERPRARDRLRAGGPRRPGPRPADERIAQFLARRARRPVAPRLHRPRGRAPPGRGRRQALQRQDEFASTRSPAASPAATSRRSCWASGSPTIRSFSSSTSRPAASTSAPRPRFIA